MLNRQNLNHGLGLQRNREFNVSLKSDWPKSPRLHTPPVAVFGRGYIGSLLASALSAVSMQSIAGRRASQAAGIAIIASGPPSVAVSTELIVDWESKLARWVYHFSENFERVIYISSAGTIYGEAGETSSKEDDLLAPTSMYGKYQRRVEDFLLANCESKTTIARLTNIYGPRQLTKLNQGFVSTAVRAIRRNEALTLFGDGENVRDYIHEKDVVNAIEHLTKNPVEGIFNISSEFRHSQNEIISHVERAWGRELEVHFKPRRHCDLKNVNVSNAKLSQIFGWRPQYRIETGIQTYLKKV